MNSLKLSTEFDRGSAPPKNGLLSADEGASFDKVMLL